ncbi:MAG: aminopeptidase [Candidatus Binatus sp.]|uniref:aminopeptidase n=1 Tax=Candidatus Binatus sp. TaxID=2811406 RepID=UPI0027252B17|nr:aminopeptidase [Candidatus Binatus sp.]MDO8432409.1 aminopeptidase [Candidatus Binatus sp.]
MRGFVRRSAVVRAAALITASALLAGCYAGYLARAAYEGGRILWNRKPISVELAQRDLSPEIREKLETVLAVRKFAEENLGLEVGGAYQTIAPVDNGAVVHVVMAAPRDSLRPYTWWFPIVGSVPYRGYFDPADANAMAASLESEGLDTMVRPAVAFSSLGFFDDPVLSNLLKLDRVELAGVLIHELFHRTYYLPSDAMFDESAATYVGSAGAIAFFAATEGESAADTIAARAILDSELRFSRFLLQEQARLLKIYTSDLPEHEILKQREVAFGAIKADYAALEPTLSGLEHYDLDKQPLNNAVLVNYLIYFRDLDNFAALQRINHGDLRATIEQIIALAKAHPEDPLYAIWEATRASAAAASPASN